MNLDRKAILPLLLTCTVSFGFTQNFHWGGAIQFDYWASALESICDSLGNVYVTGSFKGKTDFDITTKEEWYTPINRMESYIAKYDSTGKLLWVNHGGPSTYNASSSIAMDKEGNILTCGTTTNNGGDVDPTRVHIQKISSDGQLLWQRVFGSDSAQMNFNYLTTDNKNNVVVSGEFQNRVVFDTTAGFVIRSKGGKDVYLLKLSPNGKVEEVKSIGGYGYLKVFQVAVHEGTTYVSGYYSGSIDVDPGPDTLWHHPINGSGCFVISLDSMYNFNWIVTLYSIVGNLQMQLDNDGNIYTALTFHKQIGIHHVNGIDTFYGGFAQASSNQKRFHELFMAKINEEGELVWGHAQKDKSFMIINDFKILSSGNFLLESGFSDTVDVDVTDSQEIVIQKGTGSLLLCLTPDMETLWYRTMKNVAGYWSGGISTDKDDNVFWHGSFDDTMDIRYSAPGRTIITGDDYWNIFLVRLGQNIFTSKVNRSVKHTLKFYPNPATDFTTIENGGNDGIWRVMIYDLPGRLVVSYTYPISREKVRLNTSRLKRGPYRVIVNNSRTGTFFVH